MKAFLRRIAVLGLVAVSLAAATSATAQSAPSPYTSATRYDLAGRVTGTISADPDGVGTGNPFLATRTSYDARGNPIKVESGTLSTWQDQTKNPLSDWGSAFQANTTVLTTYDGLDRKVTVTVEGSDLVPVSLTQYSYDIAGRLECTAVRMNPSVYSSLPVSACTQGTAGSNGPDRISKNVYDAAGQLVQVRQGVGSTIEVAEVTYSYTPNGQKQYVIDADGNRAQLTYDGFDRQASWIFPSATPPSSYNDSTQATALSSAGSVNSGDHEDYGYDFNGNRTSLRKRDGRTIAYTYDNLNRVTLKDYPSGGATKVYYGYDARGLQLYARFSSTSGDGITYTYDGFGRALSETQAIDGTSRPLTSAYDADSNRTHLTYPDGNYVDYHLDGLDRLYYSTLSEVAGNLFGYDAAGLLYANYRWNISAGSWWGGLISSYTYDPAQRLYVESHDVPGTTYDSSTTFTRNPASQITSQVRTNDLYSWNGQFTVNRGYTANGLNQYSAAGGAGFTYDANGNLTSDGTYTYGYDIENRLVSRTGGGTTVTLRYDPLGRLYEVNSSATGITRFLNDGDAIIAEYNSGGTMLRRFVHGTSAGDDPLVWFEGAGVADTARRYLYADERGSIAGITDSGGNVLNVNTYDEYGIPSAANQGRFQYTGQAWLPEIGMYYYKARIYSPTLGRFLQTDPIGYADQFNLYAYVGDDPVDGTDVSGTIAEFGTCTGSVACGGGDPSVAGSWTASPGVSIAGEAPEDSAKKNNLSSQLGNVAKEVKNSIKSAEKDVQKASDDVVEGIQEAIDAVATVSDKSGLTDHARQRSEEARHGRSERDVGDRSQVIRDGRRLKDNDTGYDVYVLRDRVVIVDPASGKVVTQFKNSQRNTNARIRNDRWSPY